MDNILSPSYYTVILVYVVFGLAVWYAGKRVKKFNPNRVESNFQMLVELIFDFFGGVVEGILGAKYRDKFTPLAMTMWLTIFLSNMAGLYLMKESALDLNYPLSMGILAFVFWNGYALKIVGIKGWLGQFGDPFLALAPLDFVGFVAKPVSMIMRLFGNVLSGTIFISLIMQLPHAAFEASTALGVVLTPVFMVIVAALSFYFSLFGPFIQSMVFTYLTLVNLSLLINEEE